MDYVRITVVLVRLYIKIGRLFLTPSLIVFIPILHHSTPQCFCRITSQANSPVSSRHKHPLSFVLTSVIQPR